MCLLLLLQNPYHCIVSNSVLKPVSPYWKPPAPLGSKSYVTPTLFCCFVIEGDTFPPSLLFADADESAFGWLDTRENVAEKTKINIRTEALRLISCFENPGLTGSIGPPQAEGGGETRLNNSSVVCIPGNACWVGGNSVPHLRVLY